MGDWNPNTPTIQGNEIRPGIEQGGQSKGNNFAFMQRVRPGATTISHVHSFLEAVQGAPGLGIELIDTIIPARTDETHFPGQDPGATKAAWQTLAGGTSTFAAIDDEYDDSDGLRNINAVGLANSISLMFRGNDAALSGKRIDRVQIWARAQFVWPSFSTPQVRIRGRVNLAGQDYTYQPGAIIPADNITRTVKLADWQLSPATGVPWTQAEVNGFITTAGTDEAGFIADQAHIDVNALKILGLKTVVTTAPENRRGFFYTNAPPRVGWARNALSGTSGLSAATWYWLLVYALRGSTRDFFTIPVTYAPGITVTTDPTATGEHRLGSAVNLTGPSGLIDSVAADAPGTFMPFLLDASGTINSQSVPRAGLNPLRFDSAQAANRGQEITSAGGSNTYAGVSLPVAWYDPNNVPDAPLIVEIRYGAGSRTGGGTLLATATLHPSNNPTWPGINPDGADTFIQFDGGNATPPATTQLFALIKSAASSGRGWRVPRLDDRSDFLSSGGGTTAAMVDGETVGGTTDSYSEGGTENDRYDIPVALIGPPAAPAGPTATVRAAT